MALYAVPSLWVNLLYDQTRLGGDPSIWLVLSIVAYLATLIPLIIARYTVLRVDTDRPARPLVALCVYLVAAGTRVGIALPLGLHWGVFPQDEILYRITSAPLNVVFWMVVITALVDATIRHRSRMRELLTRRAELTQRKASIDSVIAADAESVRRTVISALEPSLSMLHERVDSADVRHGARVVSALRSTIDDVVRPLSERIAHGAHYPERAPATTVRTGRWWGMPLRIRVRDVMMPGTVALIALYSGFVPTLAMQGWQVTLFLVAPTALLTWVAGGAVRRRWGHIALPVGGPFALTIVVYSVSGMVAGSAAMALFPAIPSALVAQYAVTIVAIALAVAVFGLVTVTREAVLTEVALTNAQLSEVTAELRQRMWVSRAHLAATLHGPVQAAFQVAALRISHAPEVTPALVAELEDMVNDAISMLNEPAYISHEQVLRIRDDLISMWETACAISLDIEPEALERGIQNQAALRCVIEVLRESITNALKHGAATWVDITVALGDSGITVCARNNGAPPPADRTEGFGLMAIAEFSRSWALTREGEFTVLTVDVPLPTEPSTRD